MISKLARLIKADEGTTADHPLAVIIKGNPKWVDGKHKQWADKFYAKIRHFLERYGYEVKFDAGKPYTSPPKAKLWIGHSRGADRLRFAPKGTKCIAFGTPGKSNKKFDVINHPRDKPSVKGTPVREHYVFTPLMRDVLLELIHGEERIATYQEEETSTFTHDKVKYHLNTVLKLVERKQITKFAVQDLAWLLKHTTPAPGRVRRSDLSAPILVIEWHGKLVVLDGLHRLVKAIQRGEDTLPGRMVTKQELMKAQLARRTNKPAALAITFRPDGKTLLLLRKSPPTVWSPPGGYVDEGESSQQAALRELNEETGLTGRVVGELPSPNTLKLYVISVTGPASNVTLSSEHYAAGWYSLDKLPMSRGMSPKIQVFQRAYRMFIAAKGK